HQVSGGPGVEIAVGEYAGHAEAVEVGNIAGADHLPLIHENRIDPRVVRAVADGVVVKIGNGFVQVVKDLGVPADIGVQNVFGELQGDGHGVAIVVVNHILAPIDERRIKILGMGEMPFVEIDHAVAAVDFNDGSN